MSNLRQEIEDLKPTPAFTGAAWGVLAIGAISFLVGIVRVDTLALSEKGFYVAVLALGLYAAISLQKNRTRPSRRFARIRNVLFN